MKEALAAEAAEKMRAAEESSRRALEQAARVADEAHLERMRVIQAAEQLRHEAQVEVNAAEVETRAARADRDRGEERVRQVLQEAQSQAAKTAHQLKLVEEARAIDAAKLADTQREAHRIIKEERDAATAANQAMADAEHRSRKATESARTLEEQKRLAEERRAEAERVTREAMLSSKATEQALVQAAIAREDSLSRELAAVKAQAAGAEAKSQKLARQLHEREVAKSRSIERERPNSDLSSALMKDIQEIKAAATTSASAAMAAQEASRKMTEESHRQREDVKRWMEEIEERQSVRSSQRSTGPRTAPSVDSALSARRRNNLSTTELMHADARREITIQENGVLNLPENPKSTWPPTSRASLFTT